MNALGEQEIVRLQTSAAFRHGVEINFQRFASTSAVPKLLYLDMRIRTNLVVKHVLKLRRLRKIYLRFYVLKTEKTFKLSCEQIKRIKDRFLLNE